MLRTTIAAIAVVGALGLAGAPAATGDPGPTGTESSQSDSQPNRITKQRHLAGHPVPSFAEQRKKFLQDRKAQRTAEIREQFGQSPVVRGPNKPPNASQTPRAIAAHRVADPIAKRIIEKIRSHFG
ncbi:hypothetical protein NLX62_04840 [Mycobacteriaceae bacterium Msp059]|nr:hypothetical protein [Mycobacteriaceae bacterium Msp059]